VNFGQAVNGSAIDSKVQVLRQQIRLLEMQIQELLAKKAGDNKLRAGGQPGLRPLGEMAPRA
jgi:hypothetical protein